MFDSICFLLLLALNTVKYPSSTTEQGVLNGTSVPKPMFSVRDTLTFSASHWCWCCSPIASKSFLIRANDAHSCSKSACTGRMCWIHCVAARKDDAYQSVPFALLCNHSSLSSLTVHCHELRRYCPAAVRDVRHVCCLHTAHWLSHSCFLTTSAHWVARQLCSSLKNLRFFFVKWE